MKLSRRTRTAKKGTTTMMKTRSLFTSFNHQRHLSQTNPSRMLCQLPSFIAACLFRPAHEEKEEAGKDGENEGDEGDDEAREGVDEAHEGDEEVVEIVDMYDDDSDDS